MKIFHRTTWVVILTCLIGLSTTLHAQTRRNTAKPASTTAQKSSTSNLIPEKSSNREVQDLMNYAAEGMPGAQYLLGMKYIRGNDVPQDVEKGVKWLSLAADKNHAGAQFALATLYRDGNGVSRDPARSFTYMQKSAENGYVRAQVSMGIKYMKGDTGLEPNMAEAAKWLKLAADKGSSTAQYHLARLLEKGDGIDQNKEEAYNWYLAAAMQGHEDAKTAVASFNR